MNDMGHDIGGLLLTAPRTAEFDTLLTPEALALVAGLHRAFAARIRTLQAARQQRLAAAEPAAWRASVDDLADRRDSDWTVDAVPEDLQDRRVELTGPASDHKLVINALNAPVQGFMADFEDSLVPTWAALMQGQINLRDAVAGTLAHTDPDTGKVYTVDSPSVALHLRPRGLQQAETHLRVDDAPGIGALLDAGLYLFHNARPLMAQGRTPSLYLPKLDGAEDAELWNDVLNWLQDELGIPRGAVKVTVLIETLTAALQMDGILHALRNHAVALACGRWGYIASAMKTLRADPDRLWPGRQQLEMHQTFLDSLSKQLCQTAHARGALAMGGMAKRVPVHNDPAANDKALAAVRGDKQRELDNGHDGTWVAHPALAPVAAEVFGALEAPNQLGRALDWAITTDDLLAQPAGEITEVDLRNNIGVFVQYLEAWLGGQGTVALYNRMEDATTAEICRVQLWHWLHHPDAALADGRAIDTELFESVLAEELEIIEAEVGEARYAGGRFVMAAELMRGLCLAPDCADSFLAAARERLLETP